MADIPKRLANGHARIVRRGGIVLVHFGPEGGETQFQLLDGGGVSKAMVENLVLAGLLQAQGDGLLPGTTQSYRAV